MRRRAGSPTASHNRPSTGGCPYGVGLPARKFVNRITEEEKLAVANGTLNIHELVKDSGVHVHSLRRYFKNAGIKIPRRRGSYRKIPNKNKIVVSKKDIKDYLNNNITFDLLVKKYKVSRGGLYGALIRQHIVKRPNGNHHRFVVSKDDITRLITRQVTIDELAKQRKTTHVTLSRAMCRQGVEIPEGV